MNGEYVVRRERVLDAIHPGVLLASAGTQAGYGSVADPFRQDSDFFYLTGFDEPDAVLVLVSGETRRSVIFLRPRDVERERWEGERLGVERAVERMGLDEAYPISELDSRLPGLFENTARLFYRLGNDRRLDDRVLDAVNAVRAKARQSVWWPSSIVEPSEVTGELRLVKSEGEIRLIQRAADLSAVGHRAVMRAARAGMGEHELEAILLATFRAGGARRAAYPSIVGSGSNATVLHYVANDCALRTGDLVLVDAGCEYQHYAADITRTFPVDGRFSEAQAQIYDLVLAAQVAAIDRVRVGATMEDLHAVAVRVLTEGLVDLGLVVGPVSEAIEDERYKPFYMHRTGHYLGLDVHDVGRYSEQGRPRPLAAGNVVTVEPGIYIPQESDVADEYRGIGVRIEDDVLVSADGPRTLTAAAPKVREDVEQACSR